MIRINSSRYSGHPHYNKISIGSILLLIIIIQRTNSLRIETTIRPLLSTSSSLSSTSTLFNINHPIDQPDNHQDGQHGSSSSTTSTTTISTISTTTNRIIILNKRLQNCWTNLSKVIGLVCSKSPTSSSKFFKLLKENYFGFLQKSKHYQSSNNENQQQQILIDCCRKPCSLDRIRRLC